MVDVYQRTEEVKGQPMIFDFYAIFQPTENLTIKGENSKCVW